MHPFKIQGSKTSEPRFQALRGDMNRHYWQPTHPQHTSGVDLSSLGPWVSPPLPYRKALGLRVKNLPPCTAVRLVGVISELYNLSSLQFPQQRNSLYVNCQCFLYRFKLLQCLCR